MKIAKIKTSFSKTTKSLAEHSFAVFLVLFICSLAFGAFLYYHYFFLVEKTEPEAIKKSVQFQESRLLNIVKVWEQRNEQLKTTETKEYRDIFK